MHQFDDEDLELQAFLKEFIPEDAKKKKSRHPEIEGDWEVWLRTVYSRYDFKEFAPFQRQFWDLAWKIKEKEHDEDIVFCIFRGGGKSSTVELAVTALLARGEKTFALYVCRNTDDAIKHVATIQAHLESDGIQKFYPEVGKPRIGLYGNQKGWRQGVLTTDSGSMIIGYGLDKPVRGVKDEDRRPNLIIFDDIDDLHDSPEATRKVKETLTKSIIPTRDQTGTSFIFCQNEIRKGSIMSQVIRNETDLLAKATKIGPIRAFEEFEYETDPDMPHRKIATGGKPNWPEGYTLETAQKDIDTMTFEAFMTEVQQEVDHFATGAIYPSWDEKIHVITKKEFIEYFGKDAMVDPDGPVDGSNFKIPWNWDLFVGQDWGTTYAHPMVNLWYGKPAETYYLNFDGLEDCYFCYREFVAPETKQEEKDAVWDAVKIGNTIVDFEALHDEGPRIGNQRVMSHEASTARSIYISQLSTPLIYSKINATSTLGIDAVNILLQPNRTKPHPFRKYPKNYPYKDDNGNPLAGQPIPGRPRLYYIVDDDQGALLWDERMRELRVQHAKDSRGLRRIRWEKPRYHWLTTAGGEEKQRPYDLDQDAMDAERYRLGALAGQINKRPPIIEARHRMQEFEKHLTQDIEEGTMTEYDRISLSAARLIEQQKVMKTIESERTPSSSGTSQRMKRRGNHKRFTGSIG